MAVRTGTAVFFALAGVFAHIKPAAAQTSRAKECETLLAKECDSAKKEGNAACEQCVRKVEGGMRPSTLFPNCTAVSQHFCKEDMIPGDPNRVCEEVFSRVCVNKTTPALCKACVRMTEKDAFKHDPRHVNCSKVARTFKCKAWTNDRVSARSQPAPGANAPWGPDVSHWQGSISWPNVSTQSPGFAIVKATEGLSYKDPSFAANWKGIESAGIKVRGAYHFGHPKDSATSQAKFFVNTVGSLKPGDFLVLDIEAADSKSPAAVAKWVGDFLSAVGSLSRLRASRVFLYTGAWFWNPQAGGSSIAQSHPLWISGYTDYSRLSMAKGWSRWTLWQYTDERMVAGIGACDASKYSGTQAQLQALVGLL